MLSEDQILIEQAANTFAQAQIKPHAAQWDKAGQFPKEAIRGLGELGLMGMLAPVEYNGAGSDYVSYALAMMAVAKADASCATIMGVNNSVVCALLAAFANENQKQQWLRPLAAGKALGAFCLSEPSAGTDAAAIKTTATLSDGQYCLNGTKQFITSGQSADYAIVVAQTAPDAGKNGLSVFLVPTDVPGYQVARIEEKLGQKASDTAQIVLNNCLIPESNRIGEEGAGYKIALSNLEGGRIGIAAQAVGIAQAALEDTIDYAKQRESFGQIIANHQAIAFMIAEMATDVEAAKQLVLSAARLKDAGSHCRQEAAMAKLYASQMVEGVCSKAIQVFGGYGYLKDFAIERYYRDARVTQIYEGTNEVQKMVIARSVLT